jgi:hypothetical protein
MPHRDFVAPTVVGIAEGWRTWAVEVAKPRYGVPPKMWSVVHHYYWTPRQLCRAECHKCNNPDGSPMLDADGYSIMPRESCSCGFYSAKSFEHLMTMHYHVYGGGDRFNVIGRVSNWGKVIEGSLGWRAEKSYPIELFIPFEYARTHARALSEGYGVPVKMRNFLTAGNAIL